MNDEEVTLRGDDLARDVTIYLRQRDHLITHETREKIHATVIDGMRRLIAEHDRERDPPLTDHVEALAKVLWAEHEYDHVLIGTEATRAGASAIVSRCLRGAVTTRLSGPPAPTNHLALLALRDELRKRVQEQQERAAKALEETR